ncbi:tol-pal system protein YbgF [Phyllobacterium brassicacearum]|uniref:Cell division coordinator CpoB n=1 Tax=Phyllobacterium brassicacearum TaxID=314235 RepID=A0A2P7BRS4_9HYPH|nr:tol-pal system protein YbgF [Phyllobacterium brassicacearum]PSH69112.1 tol-pal system protein YbgF [Phyllobacterium brassicacearum]TDQ25368.1 tol-pal system protein YbgF [Phyllobacterium brassicacearum]
MNKRLKRMVLAMTVLPFLATGSSHAAGLDGGFFPRAPKADIVSSDAPVLMAQAGDPRVSQLEEQIRQLTGKIEELNFQLLQMQEQMRKVQEDNEFRFQELEKGKRSDAGGKSNRTVASATHTRTTGEASTDASAATNQSGSMTSPDTTDSAAIDPQIDTSNSPQLGEQPRDLGQIEFDANGNVIGGTTNDNPAMSDNTTVAALPQTDDPKTLYSQAYQLFLSGDYKSAEVAFRSHVDRFPKDPADPDARYWLGESLYGQGRYQEAASVFLDNHKQFPDSKKSPENLLKLGMTLAKMRDHEVACATFASVSSRYPNISAAIKERVKNERAANKC